MSVSDIPILLEAQPYITARWLACHSDDLSYDEASKLLESVDATKTHVVTGFRKSDSTLVFNLTKNVAAVDLDSKSSHVYCVQKFSSESDPVQLEALETEQATSLLLSNTVDEKLILNNVGGIKLSSVKVLPVGKRIQSNIQLPTSSSVSAAAPATATSAPKSSMFPPKSTPFSATKSSKPPAAVSNFFGKSSGPAGSDAVGSKSAEKVEPSKTPSDDERKATQSRPKARNALEADDEEQWDDGTGIVPDKAVIREREHAELARVSKRFIVEEEDDDLVEVEGNTNSNSSDAKKKRGRGKKSSEANAGEMEEGDSSNAKKPFSLLRGAMDDYLEDVAVAAEVEKQKAEASGAPVPEPAKKKKRKLVEKMFADEKGYLVTEMVWEEVTDDESDSPSKDAAAAKAAAAAQRAKEDKPKATAKKAPPAAAAGVGQKSMMSFFTKK